MNPNKSEMHNQGELGNTDTISIQGWLEFLMVPRPFLISCLQAFVEHFKASQLPHSPMIWLSFDHTLIPVTLAELQNHLNIIEHQQQIGT